ncbi:NADH-quinone oxidoreductase subunit NuoE family protein [Paramaledivibacter caminithermalis]|jgi:NADH-quinone oxidoreductase subunit E|uniref:NADH-quinone oxidoreductase subunit E n=1 Tax=Paramaledivibacter caminithermalis (strain DSM 15212 / CIP 107654 / DViRD3) TaxID=1121301 RepID=A0A1M6R3H1_PARC5|nr:NAD(P)H-dependent oxidoreductase subunit E [Paramaledivibacter caminithermalis]SHK27045.1 NADH-quinone oxidoreductase subunit E [Paramaledivibacter caminithermalis DSM 15212]
MEKNIGNKNLIKDIDSILEKYDFDNHNLLPILQETQSLIPNHYIPEEVAKYIALKLNTPTSKVYDVISFFSSLSDKPKGLHVIQLCKSAVCRLNKYQTVRDILERELGIKMGEISDDGLFSLEYTACFGACDISPAFRIDNRVYGNLTEDKIIEIINNYRRFNHG